MALRTNHDSIRDNCPAIIGKLLNTINPISTRVGPAICPLMVKIEHWRLLTFPECAQRPFKKILVKLIQDQLLENSSVQIVKDFTRSELYGRTVSQS
jgi:hypothetical protein